MLNCIIHGEARQDVVPLLVVHGLFGSARNWGVIAKRLSDQRQVIAVDMRNHGDSDWKDGHSYFDLADDLAEVINAHGTKMDVLGHSMGGKASMVLATAHPELLRKLIVADIAPVTYSHTQMPIIDAMRSVDLDRIKTRGDADSQLQNIIPERAVRAFILQNLDPKSKSWRLNLDVLARDMPRIIGFPDIDGVFDGPTLFLSGGASDYVQREHRSKITKLFPQAKFVKIPGAGHWLHAEKPREFEATARVFLSS
ncbi:alpha/beta fold hydrolase [Qingshengfaniella alkalisoli]|uniref:Alpha/beta fold hydrolase n=1 Tax=Qingshengfaniella alkalisoli TaxID=2599296 RepID=A0A5B8I5D8_9RHOB|nr:alpha/beta fold hydrolase [Qingshengfaniella alkalisoli]QDY68529.1 alpha/beta fold hydrolase [Qingshengfaniella alkalisoli]